MFKIFILIPLFFFLYILPEENGEIKNETIDAEKIIIERVKYHTEKINLIINTFSKLFSDNKNIDILKYIVCKYIIPQYLYTNSLQLLSHQLVLNLKNKCPECVLGFYKTLEETPPDFQLAAKIFNFVPKFADYKLKIQALQTLLHTFNFYSEDIINILKENNYQKLMDYIVLIEEELINTYSELYTNWDQNKKKCSISFLEDISFDKCIKGKEIPKIDKGEINCQCDNRIPLSSYEYFNTLAHHPLDSIFNINIIYSSHFLDEIKQALNFSYTFKQFIEQNFPNLYKILYPTIANNENIVYELCTTTCRNLQDPSNISLQINKLIALCDPITDSQQCRNNKCVWCNNKCVALPSQCNAFICKNTADVSSSRIKKCDLLFPPKWDPRFTDGNKAGVYLNCMDKHYTKEEVLKLCKKFNTVYVCDYFWIHKIGDQEYDTERKDCYWYDICKCFDKQDIESSKGDIDIPKCEPILPK